MPKRRTTLHTRLPLYRTPRNEWRREIHGVVAELARSVGVRYAPTDELEVELLLYLPPSAVRFHDVDNRLKDVMDALQGRAGGPKSRRPLPPIVPNDRQVRRVVVEKMVAPKQSGGSGHLTIRACRARPTAR